MYILDYSTPETTIVFVLVMGCVLTILIGQIFTQKEALEIKAEATPGEQITKTSIPTGVHVQSPSHKNPQVKDIGEVPPEHIKIDIPISVSLADSQVSDTVSLLHQIPFEAQAISNPEIAPHRDLNLERRVQQIPHGVSDNVSLVTFGLNPASVPESEAEIQDLRTESKVATLVTIIAGGGIVSVISGLLGNEKAKLTHSIFFRVFTSLNYLSLVSGICLFLLIFTRPSIPGFVKIVKFTKWFALALMTYSLGCATCLLFPHLAAVLLVLVVPLVVALLIVTLSFCPRN